MEDKPKKKRGRPKKVVEEKPKEEKVEEKPKEEKVDENKVALKPSYRVSKLNIK